MVVLLTRRPFGWVLLPYIVEALVGPAAANIGADIAATPREDQRRRWRLVRRRWSRSQICGRCRTRNERGQCESGKRNKCRSSERWFVCLRRRLAPAGLTSASGQRQ